MKKVLLVLGLTALVVTLVSPVVAAPIETKAGTKAMVFQFSGLSDLGLGRYSGGIGMRYYMSDDMAIRPGVQLGYSTSKNKNTDPEAETSMMNVGANLTLEKHFGGGNSVSPYVGAQAGVSYRQDKETNVDAEDLEVKDKLMSFSVGGVLGFEWGFTESLTLGGEYGLGLAVTSHKIEATTDGTTDTTVDGSGMTLGISTASVFLSVTF